MRFIAGLVLAIAGMLSSIPLAADQGTYPKTEEELNAAYDALHWQDTAGSYKLPASHAVIELTLGQALLLGTDAERYSWLANGVEFPDTEAVLTDANAKTLVYYEWRSEGYVNDSDWEDVDGDGLLKDYSNSTDAANEGRTKNGLKPMHVVSWLEPPHYDKTSQTVTFALELKDDEGSWANAVALRLGRAGYTEFTWVGSIDGFRNAAGRPDLLNQALAAHAFEEGHRYVDFKDGDKVAAYGIAGLVATALGVSFSKGIMAALLGLLIAGKKLTLVLIAVVASIVYKFKGLFRSFRPKS